MITMTVITSIFISMITTVLFSIANPILMNALAIRASELVATAGRVGARMFVTVVIAIKVMVTDKGARDTISVVTLKLVV